MSHAASSIPTRLRRLPASVALVALLLLAAAPTGLLASAQEGTPEVSPIASPAAGETVALTGLVDAPGPLTVADLQALPAQTIDVTFQSGQGPQSHAYTGTPLYGVLERAGITVDPDVKNDALHRYVVVTAKDGYEVVISLGEIDPGFGDRPYLLAWDEDGAPLTGDDGPVRLVVPGDVKGGRYVSGVITIEVRDVDSAPRA